MNDHKEPGQSNDPTKQEAEIHDPERDETTNNFSEEFKALAKFLKEWPKSEIIQGLILFVGAVYCVVTIGLWCAARRANDIATQNLAAVNRNFRLDERAWISFTTAPNYAMDQAGHIVWSAQIQNVGKSPARSVDGAMIGTILKQGDEPDLNIIPNPHTALHYPALFQNISASTILPVLHYLPASGAPVYPSELTDGKSYVIAYGQITFDDIFGGHHWTHFCVSYPTPTKKCVQYNDTDGD